MKINSPKYIKKILKNGPVKNLGQNFLIDETIIKKIIDIAEVENSCVLEIGPGLGALTYKLIERAEKVLAVEKDSNLISELKKIKASNLELINTDFLKVDTSDLFEGDYKVVANLPFNVATAIIRKLLTKENPTSITVILQKEVAERITSKGDKENFLSITTKVQGDPEIKGIVPRNCFWPAPQVDGAILKIKPLPKKDNFSYGNFFNVVEAGFRHPRKQLKNNLSQLKLTKKQVVQLLISLDLNPKIRAEDLSLNDWKRLTEKYLTLTEKENKIN